MNGRAMSLESMLKNLSDVSKSLLARNIIGSSREKRRQKEYRKRGLPAQPARFVPQEGTVRVVEGTLAIGTSNQYLVGGTEFYIDAKSTVYGDLKVGAFCSITLLMREGRKPYATKIVSRGL